MHKHSYRNSALKREQETVKRLRAKLSERATSLRGHYEQLTIFRKQRSDLLVCLTKAPVPFPAPISDDRYGMVVHN